MQPPKILDNKQQGKVIDELRAGIRPGAKLAVISAYFTIYAYEALKKELSQIEEMRFIFTTPSYIKQKNDFNYDVLNHTDLSRYKGMSGAINLATLNWENYDLIVIDESHNFRNNVPHKDHKTRYERLMEDIIKAGVKTKVLMLSATPVNNRMNDIKNQIAFITEGKNDDVV